MMRRPAMSSASGLDDAVVENLGAEERMREGRAVVVVLVLRNCREEALAVLVLKWKSGTEEMQGRGTGSIGAQMSSGTEELQGRDTGSFWCSNEQYWY